MNKVNRTSGGYLGLFTRKKILSQAYKKLLKVSINYLNNINKLSIINRGL